MKDIHAPQDVLSTASCYSGPFIYSRLNAQCCSSVKRPLLDLTKHGDRPNFSGHVSTLMSINEMASTRMGGLRGCPETAPKSKATQPVWRRREGGSAGDTVAG